MKSTKIAVIILASVMVTMGTTIFPTLLQQANASLGQFRINKNPKRIEQTNDSLLLIVEMFSSFFKQIVMSR